MAKYHLCFRCKGIVLLLGAFGIATMWEAVFSDVGVTLLAVLNAMRVLRVKDLKRGRNLRPLFIGYFVEIDLIK